MPVKDLHNKPFDEGTITKLEIFENYAKEWLPTMIMGFPKKKLCLFDCFAGTGYDKNGVSGSPIRLLQQIDYQANNIFNKKNQVFVYFNEYDKNKYNLLEDACNDFIENSTGLKKLKEYNRFNIFFYNEDFTELFPKMLETIKKYPSLLYLDQNGMRFLADEYLLDLEKLKTTDFIYYLSSSYFVRFGNTRPFQTNMQIDIVKARENPYKYIHKSILEQLREKLPERTELKLYPFTIKKKANIYGIIFGAKHPRAVDKFLKTAWNMNAINGEANFDIDDDLKKCQLSLFGDEKLTKIDEFKRKIRELVLSGGIRTNKEAYDYVLNQGHLPSHASDEIKLMKKEKLIDYNSKQPLINYEQAYKNKRILEYTIIKK